MINIRPVTTPLLLFSAALAVTACGGDSDNAPLAPAAPEKPLNISDFQAADYVIGQPDFGSNTYQTTPNGSNLNSPYAAPHYSNGVLYVADYGFNRILGFHSLPEVNNPGADFVLGQADFTSQSSGSQADTLNGPQSPIVSGEKLFVADYDNHRVLIFDPAPSAPASANTVVGQSGFGMNEFGCSASNLSNPETLAVSGDKLVVTDSANHRVLIWNSIPGEHGQAADLVLGQDYFTACNSNRGGDVAANTLYYPAGVWTDGTRLAVIDSSNNRVLIWNTFPTVNGQDADLVLGQQDFTLNARNDDNGDGYFDGPSARTLFHPLDGITSDGNSLFVTDTGNNRLLVWKRWPTENFQPADTVLGQSDFTHVTGNDDDQNGTIDPYEAPTARTLRGPSGVALAENRYLLVTDGENYRVLVFDLDQ